jgi:phosphate acyltransferase
VNQSTEQTGALPIALDVMGGDYGPATVIQGAVLAARRYGLSAILVGEEKAIKGELKRLGAQSLPLLQTRFTAEAVSMEDSASAVIRHKTEASIRLAFELIKETKAGTVISVGNTGAVMAAGIHVSGTIPGIARPAIACLIPRPGKLPPVALIDSGANTDCHAYQLIQFAAMGHFYSKLALGIAKPRVALLANGTEPKKGTDMLRAASSRLRSMEGLNFVGYVEGSGLTKDIADIVVCDGLVGNIVLKNIEGTVELVIESMKHMAAGSLSGQLGLWLARSTFRRLFEEVLNPAAHGGAPLLGLNAPAIVCHGASSPMAVMNAMRIAHKFAAERVVEKITQALSDLEESLSEVVEDGVWSGAAKL